MGTDPDVLLSRVLDGEATPEDWAAFRSLASHQPSIWQELAEAQQDRAAMDEAIRSAVEIADLVEAPIETHLSERLAGRARRALSYGGWLVAAVVALTAIVQPVLRVEPAGPASGALTAASLSPEDALRAYFDRGAEAGRVLGELPEPRVLQYRLADDGQGVEVVYLRQIVERAIVDDVYSVGVTDTGRAVPVRAELPSGANNWRF